MADDAERPRRRGFLALPREILSQDRDGWFVGNRQLAFIYIALVHDANWADSKTPLPRQKIVLKQGQLVIGLRKWARQQGISLQTLRSTLNQLTNQHKINTLANTLGTIVTIVNYKELFLNWPDAQHTNQHATNTPTNTRLTPSEQLTENNNEQKERAAPPPPPPDMNVTAFDLKAAGWLQKAILLHSPNLIRVRNAKVEAWAKTFTLMREKDGLSEKVITETLMATFEPTHPQFDPDPFWRCQILSAGLFREKWDKLSAQMMARRAEGFNP